MHTNRASYGKKILVDTSSQLTAELGKGIDASNLYKMRSFYSTFPNLYSVRLELSWTHYRSIIRIKDAEARNCYIADYISENWSARALDKQISTQNYTRTLSSKNPDAIRAEAKTC
jgi:hypothetical protein